MASATDTTSAGDRTRPPAALESALLDAQDKAHAARSLAGALMLAVDGLDAGSDRDALGRLADLVAGEITALAEQLERIRRTHR